MSSQKAYSQILKATSIMAFSSLIVQITGMIRTKVAAELIGSIGVGMATSFIATQNLFGVIFSLGLHSSAVRDLSLAIGTDDRGLFGKTLITLRRLCLFSGIVGMCLFILMSSTISQVTFGNKDHSYGISMLGLAILFANISGGEMAILQATSRISEMAKVNILAGIFGSLFAVFFYAVYGSDGVVPSLVAMSAALLISSYFFSRKIRVPNVNQTIFETFIQANHMIKLGFVMMINGLLVSFVGYITVVLIQEYEGLVGVGFYSAAYALSGVFVNFVLSSMAASYFPQLAGAIANKSDANTMVNRQTEVAILVALPGLLITFILAPWLIKVFYSGQFTPAIKLVHWFIMGCLGRIFTWPLGFLMLALGKGRLFLVTEIFFNAMHLGLILCGLKFYGLEGVAIAYFLIYILYLPYVYYFGGRLTNFRWSKECKKIIIFSIVIFACIFFVHRLFSEFPIALSTLIWIMVFRYSLQGVIARIGIDNRFIKPILKIGILRKILSVKF